MTDLVAVLRSLRPGVACARLGVLNPSTGRHYLQAMEYNTGGGAGTNGGTGSGLAAYAGQYQSLAAHLFM